MCLGRRLCASAGPLAPCADTDTDMSARPLTPWLASSQLLLPTVPEEVCVALLWQKRAMHAVCNETAQGEATAPCDRCSADAIAHSLRRLITVAPSTNACAAPRNVVLLMTDTPTVEARFAEAMQTLKTTSVGTGAGGNAPPALPESAELRVVALESDSIADVNAMAFASVAAEWFMGPPRSEVTASMVLFRAAEQKQDDSGAWGSFCGDGSSAL